ncbi:UDP-N-acetylmuramate--L-alanine ligase [Pedobacter psychrophilus]|uniref:UDP-N-acetylmuramate--L-alanine ligase n=1 Tax=Pedobacter psychrophilus TaxID=1826909 RepID=A0A179DPC0_9SPHI|nr:UDP-N-acetylmuramate--L-alanine ligase [Pedobacter psychrophilus]OAQ42389.1 UDP-N-acetylmuramate--L-alanine ligase [Pedobacter psychrophilus]
MDLNNIKRVYLIGIGGIGMSGLARYFHQKGFLVCGYDKTPTGLTQALVKEGICISYEDEPNLIPISFQQKDKETLIIFTPAIPAESKIQKYFKNKGFELYKRSQVLGMISKDLFTIAVAGTHGKTTTSSLITHLLKCGDIDCSAFLGGIATNYDSNLIIGKSDVLVVEADEYDRSFLTLHPNLAVITSMDADHLDIYGAEAQLHESFHLFAKQVKDNGELIFREGLNLENGTTYALSSSAKAKGLNVRIENGTFFFDFENENTSIKDLELGLPGKHNVENAVAAVDIALKMKLNPDQIRLGLSSFKGVKRRFEYHVKEERIYIDDYAHHPAELKACFEAVRSLYPTKKLTVIFQPHLFSRTRDFEKDFVEVLNTVDELILLDIYPAREKPIPGVTSQVLANQMDSGKVRVCGKEETLEIIRNENPELLLTVGAGDIDTLVLPLKNVMNHV